MGARNETGAQALDRLAGKDLNRSGSVVNLVICGSSKFYDYAVIEDVMDDWVRFNEEPDLIILGGASGIDYLAERWADNNHIPIAVFSEAWLGTRTGLQDDGRPEADPNLVRRMLAKATHVLALPGPNSKWTHVMIETAKSRDIPTAVFELNETLAP